MQRLFIRFYLFIVLCLMFLGWGIETLWYRTHPAPAQLSPTQTALITSLHQQLTQSHQPERLLKQLNFTLKLPLQLISADEIHFSTVSLQQLASKQSILLYDHQDNPIIYRQISASPHMLLMVGPINETESYHQTPISLYILFYLLLGLLIAIWLWPLWRDLRRVQQQCEHLGRTKAQHNNSLTNKIGKYSPIYPIAQTIQQMSDRIKGLLQAQKEMSDAVSHELRTPLARIKFALAILPSGCAQETKAIETDISEMEEIIEQLLDFARLEADEPNLHYEQIDLGQLLNHQIEKMQLTSEKQFQLSQISYQDNPIIFRGDGFYLERVISNLLSNANRYAKQQVHIRLKQTPLITQLHFDNDGPAIPAEKMATIFNPFYRLDKSRGKATGGVGLGLAIVQRLVQWHGGECSVTTSALGGACFTLSFVHKKANH